METLLQAGLNNALSATVLALVVACLGWILARKPAVLHCLWFLVLLKLVMPPLYEVSIPCPGLLRAVPESLTVEESVEPSRTSIEAMVVEFGVDSIDVSPKSDRASLATVGLIGWLRTIGMRLIGTIWLAGTIVTLLVSCWRIHKFQLLLNVAQPASEEVQGWVDELSADLGLGRSPSVWWISGKLSPMLWALGRSPRLIIPIELWKGLDNRQRATLLVHELAHLRRGDHHVRTFELVVTALYWWNPVLWWVRRALRDVEEQCCDAWVVWAFPEAAKSYAETLLETLDFLHQSDHVEPLLASGFGKVHHLRKRLTMIMNGNTPRSVSIWGALGALSLAVSLLPFNASWAQQADEPKEVEVVVKKVDEPVNSAVETLTVETVAHPLVTTVLEVQPQVQFLAGVLGSIENAAPGMIVVRTESDGSDKPADAKQVIKLEVKIDDSAFVIEADSVKEAIIKLKEHIDALSKKSPQSAQDKMQAEALGKAVKSLLESTNHINQAKKAKIEHKAIVLKQLADKLHDEKRELILKLEQDKKLSEEDAARLSAAKAQKLKALEEVNVVLDAGVDGVKLAAKKAAERTAIRDKVLLLSKELEAKRAEVEAAKKKLFELDHTADRKSPQTFIVTKSLSTSPRYDTVKLADPTKHQVEVRVDSKGAQIKGRALTVIGSKAQLSDQKRIDELEKTLQKLLEEVASLKKAKSGADR